jgi:hypothetical protein
VPLTLAETLAFDDVPGLLPTADWIPYDVNARLWSDRAEKYRWLYVPGGGQIAFSTDDWTLPTGSILMKHFELPVDEDDPAVLARVETRFLVITDFGAYGVTYRWRPDELEADLLTTSETRDFTISAIAGDWTQTWTFPGPNDCMACHTLGAGFALGPRTRQLNRDHDYGGAVGIKNQLEHLSDLGAFDTVLDPLSIPGMPRLSRIDDISETEEQRVRSYLDANCGGCHGYGSLEVSWDARYTSPHSAILDAPVQNAVLPGIDELIDSGHPPQSMIRHRTATSLDFAMPPLGRSLVHTEWVELLDSYICSLGDCAIVPEAVPGLSAPALIGVGALILAVGLQLAGRRPRPTSGAPRRYST